MYKKYLVLGLVTLALVGAGCGKDDDDDATNTSNSTNTNAVVNTNTTNKNTNVNKNSNASMNTNEDEDEDEDDTANINAAEDDEDVAEEGLEEPAVNEDVVESAPMAVTITMADMAFSADRTVATGATITVVNNDSVPHTLTADDGSFDTGIIAAGDSATFTAPATAGGYDYTCTLHPGMTGTLMVE